MTAVDEAERRNHHGDTKGKREMRQAAGWGLGQAEDASGYEAT